MNPTLDILEAQVLALGADDRAHLLDRLSTHDPSVESAWPGKAMLRDAEIQSGAVAPIALSEVLDGLRAGLS